MGIETSVRILKQQEKPEFLMTQSCHTNPGFLLCEEKINCYFLAFLFHLAKPDANVHTF